MRKLVSLGLLASSFIMFSSSVFAGNVKECEFLKDGDYSKGLYGLCIAYLNTTNAKAQEKILANYRKKAGPDDPVMPGTERQVAPCTCWSADHVADAIDDPDNIPLYYSCDASGASMEVANFNGNRMSFFAFPDLCAFVHPEDLVGFTPYESDAAELTCRAGIHEIVWEIWGDDCEISRD